MDKQQIEFFNDHILKEVFSKSNRALVDKKLESLFKALPNTRYVLEAAQNYTNHKVLLSSEYTAGDKFKINSVLNNAWYNFWINNTTTPDDEKLIKEIFKKFTPIQQNKLKASINKKPNEILVKKLTLKEAFIFYRRGDPEFLEEWLNGRSKVNGESIRMITENLGILLGDGKFILGTLPLFTKALKLYPKDNSMYTWLRLYRLKIISNKQSVFYESSTDFNDFLKAVKEKHVSALGKNETLKSVTHDLIGEINSKEYLHNYLALIGNFTNKYQTGAKQYLDNVTTLFKECRPVLKKVYERKLGMNFDASDVVMAGWQELVSNYPKYAKELSSGISESELKDNFKRFSSILTYERLNFDLDDNNNIKKKNKL